MWIVIKEKDSDQNPDIAQTQIVATVSVDQPSLELAYDEHQVLALFQDDKFESGGALSQREILDEIARRLREAPNA